jgi:hypothetical protein
MRLEGGADETEGDGVEDNPVDALEHTNAEVETVHIHRLGSFPFPGSHLCGGFRPAWHTRSSDCQSVDRGVSIVIHELVLRDSSVREAQ